MIPRSSAMIGRWSPRAFWIARKKRFLWDRVSMFQEQQIWHRQELPRKLQIHGNDQSANSQQDRADYESAQSTRRTRFSHGLPVIERIAPKLSGFGKIIRRNTCNNSRITFCIKKKEFLVAPYIACLKNKMGYRQNLTSLSLAYVFKAYHCRKKMN